MEASLIDQLIAQCSSGAPTATVFAPIVGSGSYEEFCRAFSRRVAYEYAAGRLSFSAADQAMSCLHTFSYVSADRGMPDYSWDVYLAFDAGEYRHTDDSDEVDPESKYTRPAIQELLARDSTG